MHDPLAQPRPATARLATRAVRPAFTLTEILVVIVLIVLLLGISLPAFNALNGSRSTGGAQNQLSALLARARNEAVGSQQVRGVMFYLDPATRRVTAALVQEVDRIDSPPTGNADPSAALITHYLDLVPDRDPLALPAGVALNVIDDRAITPPAPDRDDRYIGFNNDGASTGPATATSAAPVSAAYGGVVLFDGNGRLINQTFAFRVRTIGIAGPETSVGVLLYGAGSVPAITGVVPAAGATPGTPFLRSAIGVALFDRSAYESQFGNDNAPKDPQIDTARLDYTAGTPSEQAEESWIDDNALLLLVNRYNGTLVGGE